MEHPEATEGNFYVTVDTNKYVIIENGQVKKDTTDGDYVFDEAPTGTDYTEISK